LAAGLATTFFAAGLATIFFATGFGAGFLGAGFLAAGLLKIFPNSATKTTFQSDDALKGLSN
jgi:hypothetical protein